MVLTESGILLKLLVSMFGFLTVHFMQQSNEVERNLEQQKIWVVWLSVQQNMFCELLCVTTVLLEETT
jgi:hypothetical protein